MVSDPPTFLDKVLNQPYDQEAVNKWFGAQYNLEKDPNGKNPKEPGAKLDAGKSPVLQGLVDYFPRACKAVAEVSAFGAEKYAWKGWETVPDGINRYGNALVRHLADESIEGLYTLDSKMLHAAHTAWNAMARLELLLKEGK